MGSFTNEDYLPSPEELKIDELPVSWAPMKAAAFHLGKYCDDQCKEFMLCSKEEKDPRKCVQEGKAVTKCGYEFFQKVKLNCYEDFTTFWRCLDRSDFTRYHFCRKQQQMFDKCMKENLNMERPPSGYFMKPRIHESRRPKPVHMDPADLVQGSDVVPAPSQKEVESSDSAVYGATGIRFPPGMP